ncbi:piggyBac transposable element-derived protein 4-like [Liolophura sinensis]|uniref:piggyBac transposable element-derived protein 4-like n=1 Tax=Liolophura sinensis TaxID=3198878 RepID=UPI003158F7F8
MAAPSQTPRRSSRKRVRVFDVRQVLSFLDESTNSSDGEESGSDIDVNDFHYDDPDSASESDESEHGSNVVVDNDRSDVDNTAHGHGDAGLGVSENDDQSNDSVIDNVWQTIRNLQQDEPPNVNDFTSRTGPTWTPPGDTPPVEYFDRFLQNPTPGGLSLWDVLVDETNKYYSWNLAKAGLLQEHSRYHRWNPIAVPQLRAFMGLYFNMGLIRKHSIEEYWNTTNYSQDTPLFRRVMKLQTFENILRFIHCSDSANEPKPGSRDYDPQYKFRPVLNFLNESWAREYDLGPVISIDETIVGFKGRHTLVNYIRIKKHHQWGPKEYSLADSKSGYVYETIMLLI